MRLGTGLARCPLAAAVGHTHMCILLPPQLRPTSLRAAPAGRTQQGGRCYAWVDAPARLRRYTTETGGSTEVLGQTTSFLRSVHTGAEIFLVGTAHVSAKSAEEVRDMIRVVRPDAVMVELCQGRAARLRSGAPAPQADLQEVLGSLFAPGSSFGQQFAKFSLQGFYQALRGLGMDPGAEFKVAIQEADRLGARLVCGDRDMQQTMQRLAASVSGADLMRLLTGGGSPAAAQLAAMFEGGGGAGGLAGQVEAMKNRATARQLVEYLRAACPQLATALIDERDAIMVEHLSRLRGRVVGVVGLAHLDGIERRWAALEAAQAAPAPAGARA